MEDHPLELFTPSGFLHQDIFCKAMSAEVDYLICVVNWRWRTMSARSWKVIAREAVPTMDNRLLLCAQASAHSSEHNAHHRIGQLSRPVIPLTFLRFSFLTRHSLLFSFCHFDTHLKRKERDTCRSLRLRIQQHYVVAFSQILLMWEVALSQRFYICR